MPLPPDALIAPLAEIEATVAELRGEAFLRPLKAEVLTADALRVRLDGMLAEELDADELAAMERTLVLAGVLGPDPGLRARMLDLAAGQIAGLYDPATETLSMIARDGSGELALLDRMLLAHEIAHALDDQRHDLEAIQASLPPTLDGSAVAAAIIEGSATVQMMRFLSKDVQAGRIAPRELLAYAKDEQANSADLFEAPPFYAAWLAAGYFTGMGYLLGGQPDATALLGPADPSLAPFVSATRSPPRSMEEILHPGRPDAPVIVDEASVAATVEAAGSRLGASDVLGELYIAVATTRPGRKLQGRKMADPASWTNDAATGWGGDRVWLLDGTDGGLWVTAWDTPEDRTAFLKVHRRLHPGARVVLLGERGAAQIVGVPAAQEAALAEALAARPPTFTREGLPWTP